MPDRTEAKRIVAVVDDTAASAGAFRSVLGFARRAGASVEALFVEDVAVLHLAELTVIRHVHRHGGEAGPLEVSVIERMFRSQSGRAERVVSAAATEFGLPCRLRVLRGSLAGALIEAAADADIVVIGVGANDATVRVPDDVLAEALVRLIAEVREVAAVARQLVAAVRKLVFQVTAELELYLV
jgi:hypothetical protein